MIRFISQAIQNYNATGAIMPSSRFLARAMVQSIPRKAEQRVLEVGCGTGAFTREILQHLYDGDEFHIVELNSEFCECVEKSLLETYRNEHPDVLVKVHNTPIEDSNLTGKFDAIVCGLPFNNFPVHVVNHLFETMFSLLSENGELVYFEYLGMRKLKRIFGSKRVRVQANQRTKDFNRRFQQHHGSKVTVWRNVPSCRVVRLHT